MNEELFYSNFPVPFLVSNTKTYATNGTANFIDEF